MVKKVILFVILFGILAVGVTAGMIYSKTNQNQSSSFSGEIREEEQQISTEKVIEKTIDLYGFYDENDLEIENKDIYFGIIGQSKMIPQIKGLKNKEVEEKINHDIVQKIETNVLNKLGEKGKDFTISSEVEGNFANVLSIRLYFNNGSFNLNYELVNGNELSFQDLFTQDTDPAMIVRKIIYRHNASIEEIEKFGYGESDIIHEEPYYDKEKQIWMAVYHIYNPKTDRTEMVTKEYVPEMTEYEAEKQIKKVMASLGGNFYFSPTLVEVKFEDFYANVPLTDIADKVVIYDKYRTSESIFEKDNIGVKHILTCTRKVFTNSDIEIDMNRENFFSCYEYEKSQWAVQDEIDYPAHHYLNEKQKELQDKMNAKKEEYRKLAITYPEKAYFFIGKSNVAVGKLNEKYYDTGTGYYSWNNYFSNLLETEFDIKVIVCDKKDYTKVLDIILAKRRYKNFIMYGSLYDLVAENNFVGGIEFNVPVEETKEFHVYNVETRQEIQNVKDIFLEPEKYISILVEKGKRSIQGNYVLHVDYVGSDFDEEYCYISLNDILPYINVHKIQSELLPNSNTQKVTMEEIQDWDEDKLYLAYNEIFARHGHDFQRKEYKDYFSVWDWYQPIAGKTVSLEELSEIEQYNVTFIKSVIDAK